MCMMQAVKTDLVIRLNRNSILKPMQGRINQLDLGLATRAIRKVSNFRRY